jgi:hypothetical protein
MTSASILAVILSLTAREPQTEPLQARTARLSIVSDAILSVSGQDTRLAGFLIIQALEESHFKLNVQICNCTTWDCDVGKAHGLFQLQRTPSLPKSEWESYCGTSYEAVRAGAARFKWFYDPKSLACSYGRAAGANGSCTSEASVARAKAAERVAARLQIGL